MNVKEELARRLGVAVARVDGEIWAQLVEDKEVDSVLDVRNELDVDDSGEQRTWTAEDKREWKQALEGLAGRYRKYVGFGKRMHARMERPEAASDQVVVSTTDARLDALAEILALDAARLREVREAREDLLGGVLLKPQEVPRWVDEQDAREGEVDEGAILHDPRPDGQKSGKLLVKPGGTLDRLRLLVKRLTSAYGWDEPDAVSFVLAGTTPQLKRASVAIRYRSPYPTQSRIVIEADPRTPPREVTRLYSEARLRLRKGADRPMKPKQLALAVFVAREMNKFALVGVNVSYLSSVAEDQRFRITVHSTLTDDLKPNDAPPGWRELMERWNRTYPDWAYETAAPVQHFANDARVAWKRVTGCRWTPTKDAEDEADAAGEEL